MAISLRSPLPAFVLLNLFILLKKAKKREERKGKKNLADQNHLSDEAPDFDRLSLMLSSGFLFRKKKKERGV